MKRFVPDPTSRAAALRASACALAALALSALLPQPAGAEPADLDIQQPARPLILFSATRADVGRELFVTNLSASGTRLLADLNPGAADADPRGFAMLREGEALFSGFTAGQGRELWITDGTPRGTRLVANIGHDLRGSEPEGITPLGNGRAVFAASDRNTLRSIWVTDGTEAGTRDLKPEVFNMTPWGFASLGDGRALFVARNPECTPDHVQTCRDLWTSNGTEAGTRAVHRGARAEALPYQDIRGAPVVLADGRVMFAAYTWAGGVELHVSDLTPRGTRLVRDINPGQPDSEPDFITPIGDGAALFAATDSRGRELWVSDGTRAGTRLVRDINPGALWSRPRFLTALGNGAIIFAADNAARGREPWVSDGTRAGTRLLRDIAPGAGNGLVTSPHSPFFAQVAPGLVLFQGCGFETGCELWRTGGARRGTRLVADILPGPHSHGAPAFITAIGDGRAIFAAGSPDGLGTEPYITNGRPAGTRRITDVNPGGDSSFPAAFFVLRPPGAAGGG